MTFYVIERMVGGWQRDHRDFASLDEAKKAQSVGLCHPESRILRCSVVEGTHHLGDDGRAFTVDGKRIR